MIKGVSSAIMIHIHVHNIQTPNYVKQIFNRSERRDCNVKKQFDNPHLAMDMQTK